MEAGSKESGRDVRERSDGGVPPTAGLRSPYSHGSQAGAKVTSGVSGHCEYVYLALGPEFDARRLTSDRGITPNCHRAESAHQFLDT